MKFELKYKNSQGHYGVNITRNELMKNYETSREDSFEELDYLIEMLTTPHCFHSGFAIKDYDNIYNILQENKKYKGVFFGIKTTYGKNETNSLTTSLIN